MNQPSPPQPRKRPQQSRSLLLVQAIQQACKKILDDEGPEQLSTQRIADVAGINIASLYQYYPNKEAILADVFEDQINRYMASGRERILAIHRLSHQSFEHTLRAIVEMEVDQHLLLYRMDPVFYRLYYQSFDIHRRINEITQTLDNPSWEEWFPGFVEQHQTLVRNADPTMLARMATHALRGIPLSIMAEQPTVIEGDELKEELFILLRRYLQA